MRMWLAREHKYARFSLKTRNKSTAIDKTIELELSHCDGQFYHEVEKVSICKSSLTEVSGFTRPDHFSFKQNIICVRSKETPTPVAEKI